MAEDQAADGPVPFGIEWARQYDEAIRQTVAGYEAMHAMSVSVLATVLPTRPRLLVVGAGTGEELVRLAARFPQATLTGVDPSSHMLDVARERLRKARLLDRVEFVPGLVEETFRGNGRSMPQRCSW